MDLDAKTEKLMKLEATVDNTLISTKTKRRRPPELISKLRRCRGCHRGVATGEWVGPDPPLMFRPILRLAQIR